MEVECVACFQLGEPHKWDTRRCKKCGTAAHSIRAKHCNHIRRERQKENLLSYHPTLQVQARDKDWRLVLEEWGSECFWCGCGLKDIDIEHIVPISRGGAHVVGNLVPSCPTCNGLKYCKDPLLFLWEIRKRKDDILI